MDDPLSLVLSKLDGVVRQNGHHMALCPAHADRNPSLSVKVSDAGNVLLTCYAGCQFADICRALDIHPSALFARAEPPPAPRRAVKTTRYPIRDRPGNLVATHTRIDYDDGTKTVTWPTGTRPKELPLYGIHERHAGHTHVVLVEGEKARDALVPLAPSWLLVVGTVCGAGATPSVDALADLAGLDAAVWADNDDAGRKHMERIANRLSGEPRRVHWPGAPAKGDAADWVAMGATATDFLAVLDGETGPDSSGPFLSSDGYSMNQISEERINVENRQVDDAAAGLFRPVASFMAEGEQTVTWLVEPWVRVGGLTMLAGKPKVAGKTTLMLRLVHAVLTGGDFLGRRAQQGPVLIVSEQGGASLREALAAAGVAEHPDLHVTTYRDFAMRPWPEICQLAWAYARQVGAKLLVVDTLTACASVQEENDAGEAREAMKPIAVGADESGIAAIVVFHDKKGESDVGESTRGSSAYAGAVDIVLRLVRPGGNYEPTIRKIEALSRFEQTPDELFVQLTDAGYVSLGSEDDVKAKSIRRVLAELLPRDPANPMPIEDRKYRGELKQTGIMTELKGMGIKVSRFTLDNVLHDGERAGAFGRLGSGKRNDPARYWVSDYDNPFVSSEICLQGGPSEETNLSSSISAQMVSSDGTGASEETMTAEQAALFWRAPPPD